MTLDKKILITRFSSIGDIVLCTPVIRALKLQKNWEIHFLTKTRYSALLRHNEYIDKLWSFDNEITEVSSQLKEESFDLVVDLHKNLRSKRLIALLGVRSISFDKLNVQKWFRVYTPFNFMPDKHLIDRYYEALNELSIVDDGLGMDFFHGHAPRFLENFGLKANDYIVLCLGATYVTKRIPEHLISYIITHLEHKKIVLIGGKDVESVAERLVYNFKDVFNLVGSHDLLASAAIMDYASCVVSGDTGMMHIAAALKKPIVSIWGGTHHDLGMYPYYGSMHEDKNISIVNKEINCSPCSKIGKHQCPKGHFKCMIELDPQKVIKAIQQQLSTIG